MTVDAGTETQSLLVVDRERSEHIYDGIQEKLRDLPPLRYCRFVTENPKLAFGITSSVHLMMIVVTVCLGLYGYDIIAVDDLTDSTLDVRTNDDYLRVLAWYGAFQNEMTVVRTTKTSRTNQGDCLQLFFENDNGNVLTKESIQKMKDTEELFWNNSNFQEDFCLRNQNSPNNCLKPWSMLRYFDGTFKDINPALFDPAFDNISGVLNVAKKIAVTPNIISYSLGKDTTINETYASANIARGAICVGMPLRRYKNTSDRFWQQFKQIKHFFVSNFEPFLSKFFYEGIGNMSFFYSSRTLFNHSLKITVLRDLTLFYGSFVFILLFLLSQTGSMWVSGWAVYGIMTGFFGANLIYRVVFDFRYFGLFQILALFILLCIGADDIFVFYDAWKFSEQYQYRSLAHRLSYCYRNAICAMFFTSLTTAVAFSISASSPLLGVQTFGLFSALLVVVNYVSVVLFFPTVVVSYHIYWEETDCCCTCCSQRNVNSGDDVVKKATSEDGAARRSHGKCHNSIVRFFGGPYFRFITHPVVRWVILAVFAVVVSFAVYFASRLQINDIPYVRILKENTNFGRSMSKSRVMFIPDQEFVLLVWGLKNQNLDNCHPSDYKCKGHTVWDDSFNINAPGTQQALLDLCRRLKTMSKTDRRHLFVVENFTSGEVEVSCFIDEMKSFYAAEQDRKAFGRRVYPNGTSLTVPFGESQGRILMQQNPYIYRVQFPQNFSRYFEVAVSFWLCNAFQPPFPSNQFVVYSPLLGEHIVPSETVNVTLSNENQRWVYQYGTKLRFAAIKIRTQISGQRMVFNRGLAIREAWEAYFDKEKKYMPDALHGGFQISGQSLWHWFLVQKILLESAVKGVLVGLAIALPILMFATKNIITGLMATLSIIFSTLCVVAVINMGGSTLGVTESINLTLVVGLSVDYVVHLAEGYSRSSHFCRLDRLQDSLARLGVSVLSGACTTIGGSAFLLLAEITYFVQFGLIMFATILFSIIFALGFFSTLLGIYGPEYDEGSITPLIEWLWNIVTFNKDVKETETLAQKSDSQT